MTGQAATAGRVTLERDVAVARIAFDRPAARNAMTKAMYDEFEAHLRALAADPSPRVVVLRGAGGRAFVAGSDIADLARIGSGEAGVAYERRMDRVLDALRALPMPTVAVIEGLAVGGGLNIAAACDLRIATVGARLGVPIARTVGNTISMASAARLAALAGEAMAKRMLLLGELIAAEDLAGGGFLARVVPVAEIDAAVEAVVARLLGNAPLTLRAAKAALGRLADDPGAQGDDLIRLVYGSADFAEGTRAFLGGREPRWQGR